ncbi:MAG: hypothetical protein FJ090_11360 [Deltaproteobacteria bacterium]|nr:hypothetical protein [Deltaproteobacteria bacterium]
MVGSIRAIYFLALAGLVAYTGWTILVLPMQGRGPGAVAEPSVRENPASWRAVYIPYVVSSGSSGSGGHGFGK